MPSRRELLGALAGMLGGAVLAPRSRAMSGQTPAAPDAGLAAAVRHWDELGIHRSGTETDTATALWLREAATALGLDVRLESFPFRRRTPVAATVTLADGTRLDGVPLFDGGETAPGGLSATLGDAVEVLQVPPYDSMPGARALQARRESGIPAAILAVTDDRVVRAGLALLNAESWHAPFGPPVLQLPSTALATLRAAEGTRVHVEVRFVVERTTLHNVRVDVPGRDAALAPLVVITPRSGWWHSTSERGGGIALWLDLLARVAATPPARPVVFSANTGHELGHIGMQRFLDANESLVPQAHAWIHLGANFAAADHGAVRLQASDAALMAQADAALARHGAVPATHTPLDTAPFGEARDIHAGGGRYVSLLGSNGRFHHPDDRWPDAVDLPLLERQAAAFRDLFDALAAA